MAAAKWYTKRNIGVRAAADSQDTFAIYKVMFNANRPLTVKEIAEQVGRREAEVEAILETTYYQKHYGFTKGDEIPWPPLIEGNQEDH